MTTLASVRYIVDDVAAATEFYTTHLGFTVNHDAAPAFTDVIRGALRLLLSGPTSSGARPMPDGETPVPGPSQVLVQDPAGNFVELFQPAAR